MKRFIRFSTHLEKWKTYKEKSIINFFTIRRSSRGYRFCLGEMIGISGEILHPFPDRYGEMQNIQGEIDNFLFSLKDDLLAEMDFF